MPHHIPSKRNNIIFLSKNKHFLHFRPFSEYSERGHSFIRKIIAVCQRSEKHSGFPEPAFFATLERNLLEKQSVKIGYWCQLE